MPFHRFNRHASPASAAPLASQAAKVASVALAAILALALGGCSKKLTKEESCQAKWEKASKHFAKEKYNQAKESLNDVVTTCPGSPFTEEAMFDLAESNYKLEDWSGAEAEFKSFVKDFPHSRKYGELASYRIAEVTGKQVDGPARDQTKTLGAIAAWEEFIGEYPDGPRADSARKEIDGLKSILARKHMMIARLYSRMDEPQAAAIYYKEVLKEFGGRVNERDVNLKLAECYIRLGQFDEAESYLAKFDGIAKDDPFGGKVKDAYAELEKARAKVASRHKEEQEREKSRESM